MSKKIDVELTEAQENFLKKFYEDHHLGSKKNLCTYMPIHVVEEERYIYVPYSYGIDNYSLDGHICFYENSCSHTYHSIDDLTEDWNNNVDEDYIIKYYKDVEGTKVNGVLINDEEDYINAYQIENIEVLYAIKYYVPAAFFFIREEAERYKEYQSHNLENPRVFTYSPGYSNCGEYEHFFTLLQNIGKQLSLTKDVK